MSAKIRIINVPTGANGIAILGSVLSRRYIVTESTVLADGVTPNAPQGLTITDQTPLNAGQPSAPPLPVPFGATFTMPPEQDASFHGAEGQYLSNGPGVLVGVGTTAAAPLCKVVSAGGNTAVVVTEIS